jgi:hypothetical protein
MVASLAQKLQETVETAFPRLQKLNDSEVRHKPAPNKWSKIEILGHLIDSACNNHQRFIRGQQVDKLVFPKYGQDDWVARQRYQESDWGLTVSLWRAYNLHLAQVIANIDRGKLKTICIIGDYEAVSLLFLVEDYLDHLKHHLKQIL